MLARMGTEAVRAWVVAAAVQPELNRQLRGAVVVAADGSASP